MSRPSIRARPLDPQRPLPLIRAKKDLEECEGVSKNIVQATGEAVEGKEKAKAPGKPKEDVVVKDIPIPGTVAVLSYEEDYPPTFEQPVEYIRCEGSPGGDGSEKFVAYDADSEDEAWLESFNGKRNLLSVDKFEVMIYKLEFACGKAMELVTAVQGVSSREASAIPLSREQAYDILRQTHARHAVLTSVYEYWRSKRQKLARPLMREFVPPPSATDSNPNVVFRPPRERFQRPHTRRKRENDLASYEKLFQVRENLLIARHLIRLVQSRERQKRELIDSIFQEQRMLIRRKISPKRADQDERFQAICIEEMKKRCAASSTRTDDIFPRAFTFNTMSRPPDGKGDQTEAGLNSQENGFGDVRKEKKRKRFAVSKRPLKNAIPSSQMLSMWLRTVEPAMSFTNEIVPSLIRTLQAEESQAISLGTNGSTNKAELPPEARIINNVASEGHTHTEKESSHGPRLVHANNIKKPTEPNNATEPAGSSRKVSENGTVQTGEDIAEETIVNSIRQTDPDQKSSLRRENGRVKTDNPNRINSEPSDTGAIPPKSKELSSQPHRQQCRARFGRGGRILLDRSHIDHMKQLGNTDTFFIDEYMNNVKDPT